LYDQAGAASAAQTNAKNYTDTTVMAEATARVTGDLNAISTANAYTNGQVASINTSLAGKADKSAGNNFIGDQSISGNLSVIGNGTINGLLNLPASLAGPNKPSNVLRFDGSDNSSISQSAQLQALADGSLSFQFGPTGGPISEQLTIAPTGIINFANGQTFPGTQNLTAGTGININGNTISNTGVLTFNGTNGNVSVAGDGSTVVNGGTAQNRIFSVGNIAQSQVTGLTSFLSSLSASDATKATAASITGATNTKITYNSQGIVTAGAQAASSDLSDATNLAYNNKGNIFTGGKQTLAASLTGVNGYASLNFPNTGSAPSTPATGDVWFTTGDSHLQFQSVGGVKSLAFTTDIAAGTVTGVTASSPLASSGGTTPNISLTGIVPIANGGTGSATQNFVDLNSNQLIGGTKTFSNPIAANITGSAASAASANAVAFNGITTGTNTTATMTVGTGGSIVPTGTGVINATQLGGIAAANFARSDQGNTFTGTNIFGNTATQSGGLLIPPSKPGSQIASFPFDMEAVNGANNTHIFRIIAQDGGTPNWDFQFCNSAPCTPTNNGLSIAGSTGIITFAPGQTFSGTQSLTAGSGISIVSNAINNTGVTSLTGTPNQITASASTGAVTLSLPSTVAVNISGSAATATTITGSIGGGQVTGNIAGNAVNVTGTVAVANGGTGVSIASANTVFAGPATGAGAPNFRPLAAADLPTPQNTRAICYVAGADNTSGSALTTSDSQKSFFNNLIGAMTITSAKCQVDAGSVTMNVQKNNLASAVTTSVACTSTPGTWQTLSVSGASLALGDSLDLSISAATTARRLTVCVAGTVN
jgi:hypothetical protein